MGAILSKPVAYVHAKVDQVKQAIRTRISNAKNYVCTSINDTKLAIKSRVVDTKNAISTSIHNKIDNTKTAISTRVDNTKKACRNTANCVKTSIQNRVNAVADGISTITNGVRFGGRAVATSVASIGDAVKNGAATVKSSFSGRFSRTRTRVNEDGERTSQNKLSGFKKVKYAIFVWIAILVIVIGGVLLWDVYNGDMDSAQHKIHTMYSFAYSASVLSGKILLRLCSTCLSYASTGLQIASGYIFVWSQTALTHLLYAANVTQVYSIEAAKVGFKHTIIASQTAGHFLNESAYVSAEYISAGSKVTWEYFLFACARTWIFVMYVFERGAEFAVIAAEFTISALHVALMCLARTLKSCTTYLLNATEVMLRYLLHATKAGIAFAIDCSIDAAVWSLEMLKYAATDGRVKLWANVQVLSYDLYTGSYTISELLLDTSSYVLHKTIDATVVFVQWATYALYTGSDWLVQSAKVTSEAVATGTVVVYHSTYDATITSYGAICGALTWTFDAVTTVSYTTYVYTYAVLSTGFHVVYVVTTFVYIQTDAVIRFTAYWITTIAVFLWKILSAIVMTISHVLDVALNRIGVKYLVIVSQFVMKWTLILGEIVFGFLSEVGTYLGRFFYSAGVHLYTVVYIVCLFLWQLVAGVMGVVKIFVGALVYCVTGVFQVALWFVEEIVLAYGYMLAQYNFYREGLFFGFTVLLSVYCTGLMQDRTLIDADKIDGDRDDGGHRHDDAGHGDASRGLEDLSIDEIMEESHCKESKSDATTVHETKPTFEARSPPAYVQQSVIPAYDEIDEIEEDEDIAIGDHLNSDTDDESDFELEDIPDVMDSSTSSDEGDLEPNRVEEVASPNINNQNHSELPPDDPVVIEDLLSNSTTVLPCTDDVAANPCDTIDSDNETCERDLQRAEVCEGDEFADFDELGDFPDIEQSGDELEGEDALG